MTVIDPRLARDPPASHRAQEAARRAELRSRHSDEEWRSQLAPVVALVTTRVLGTPIAEPSTPAVLDPVFREASTLLVQSIVDPERRGAGSGAAEWVLRTEVGKLLAEELKSRPETWLPVLTAELPADITSAFVDAVPPSAVQAAVETLCTWVRSRTTVAALDPSSDSSGYENLASDVARELEEARARGDLWGYCERLERIAGRPRFDAPLLWAQQLAVRGGTPVCLSWLESFRHPIATAAAVRSLRDPDLLAACLEGLGGRNVPDLFLATLVARAEVGVWEELTETLRPEARVSEPADREMRDAEWRAWNEEELPARAEKWATTVARAPLQQIGLAFLRSTFVIRGEGRRPPDALRGNLRGRVVGAMSGAAPLDDVVPQILAKHVTRGALLAALVAVHAADAPSSLQPVLSLVLESYAALSPYDYRVDSLLDDAQTLAWLLAGAIALTDDPSATWSALERAVPDRAQGWRVAPYDAEIEHRRSHVLIVGAMAGEWLHSVHREAEAADLFESVWLRIHTWARLLIDQEERGRVPLVHAWARLPVVRPNDWQQLALAQISTLEHVPWLLGCMTNMVKNAVHVGRAPVAPELREAGLRQLELLRTTWDREAQTTAEMRDAAAQLSELLGGAS